MKNYRTTFYLGYNSPYNTIQKKIVTNKLKRNHGVRIFWTNTVIFMTSQVIFKIIPVIFKTSPVIFRTDTVTFRIRPLGPLGPLRPLGLQISHK